VARKFPMANLPVTYFTMKGFRFYMKEGNKARTFQQFQPSSHHLDSIVGICLAADGDAGGVRARPPRPSTERWLPRGVIRPLWMSDSMTRKESALGEADGPHTAA